MDSDPGNGSGDEPPVCAPDPTVATTCRGAAAPPSPDRPGAPDHPGYPQPPVGLCFLRAMTLVRLRGEIGATHPVDVEALAEALVAARTAVVLNVSGVTWIDPGGLRWVMRLTRPARREGAVLILESPTACMDEMLTLTGCHHWFTAATRPGPCGRSDTTRLLQELTP